MFEYGIFFTTVKVKNSNTEHITSVIFSVALEHCLILETGNVIQQLKVCL
jgi:hypothetical protein